MTTNGTTLAVPTLTDEQLRLRLKIARSAGYGLEGATPEQLHGVYLLAQRYRLVPLLHITLYRGRPWTTIDGRVELARRHPQFRGFATRPLTKDEKLAWGYREDDLVVECVMRTRDWGEVAQRGKVSAQEQRGNTPAGTHPSEMAEKRAIARAARLAFGQSAYLDEDDVETDDAQQSSEEQARLAQRYTEIFETEPESAPPAPAPTDVVERAHHAAKQRDLDLAEIDRQRREEGLIS
jgi:hypothetical protein